MVDSRDLACWVLQKDIWMSAQSLLEPLLDMPTASYMELPHTNPWNKCPKRGLMTTGGQIPIEKHYRSLDK